MSSIQAGQAGQPRPGGPTDQAGQAAHRAYGAARRAGNSRWVDRLARVGLAARGLVYGLIGVLAFQIAFVNRGKRADQNGAFQELARNGFGKVLLWIVVVGFIGYALWQATEALWGHWRESDKRKRLMARIESGAKAVIYFLLAAAAVKVVTGSGSGGNSGSAATAKLLKMTGGQFLVGLAGIVIIAVGAGMVWRGVKAKFAEWLELGRLSPTARSAVIKLGKVGYVARGVVFAIVGILVVVAAVTFDPAKARGLDAALRTLAAQPYGPWLLSLVALGLICFGAYSFVESRYRRL